MLTFKNHELRKMLKQSRPEANKNDIDAIDFLPFSDPEESVRDDVAYLKGHELIKKVSVISGWVYNVKTGEVSKSREVAESSF